MFEDQTEAFDTTPLVMPKGLWDAMLIFYDSLTKLCEGSCGLTERLIRGARDGARLDPEALAQAEELIVGTLANLAQEKDELDKLRRLFKWVPPDIPVVH
jgi:hypothetical protein